MNAVTGQALSWYRSNAVLLIAIIVFPPLGLILLVTRPGLEYRTKLFGSLAIAVFMFAYGLVIFSVLQATGLPQIFVRGADLDSHYDELERHRAEQRAKFGTTPEATVAPDANGVPPSASNTTNSNSSTAPVPPASPAMAYNNYWTEFRGPGRAGRYEESAVLTTWPAGGLRTIWRQPIGEGYSSFAVADGQAFTIERRRQQEVAASYDIETGRELWTHAWDAEFIESQGNGPRATPTWDEGRVYVMGGTGELRCVDAKTGKLKWSRSTLTENGARNLPWGVAGSPLIVDDKVIVLPGGSPGRSVVAYNKRTGEPVWKVLNDRQAYCSPMIVTLAGRRQILVVSSSRVVGLGIENGALLWEHPWDTQMGINVSQPIVVDENRFFISAGYGKGCALIEVIASGQEFSARKLWENIRMKNKFNSSILHEKHVYGLDEGILACLNVETGELKWKGGRYGYGQVLYASGHLIVMTDDGELVLVKASPDGHQEVARFAALTGRCWNYPVIAGGKLLVRNASEMACYDIASR